MLTRRRHDRLNKGVSVTRADSTLSAIQLRQHRRKTQYYDVRTDRWDIVGCGPLHAHNYTLPRNPALSGEGAASCYSLSSCQMMQISFTGVQRRQVRRYREMSDNEYVVKTQEMITCHKSTYLSSHNQADISFQITLEQIYARTMYFCKCSGMCSTSFFSSSHLREKSLAWYLQDAQYVSIFGIISAGSVLTCMLRHIGSSLLDFPCPI